MKSFQKQYLFSCNFSIILGRKYWYYFLLGGLIVDITIMFLQQFSGINGILANLEDILIEAGLDLDPNYQSGISLIFLLVGNIVGSFMIDKIGQRNKWFITTILSFVGCFVMAINDKFRWSNILPLICIFTYNFGFGLGLSSIPWFLVFDLFDDQVREILYVIHKDAYFNFISSNMSNLLI